MSIKRMISLLITAIMCITIVPFQTVSAEDNNEITIWDGSVDRGWFDAEETEFHISTSAELMGLMSLSSEDKIKSNQTIYIDQDIYMNDISNYDQWDEEGDIKYTSSGKINRAIIDGQGHTIYGLTSRLFETNLNTIKNLNIKNYYTHHTINSFSSSKVNATAYSAFVQNNGNKETNAKIINCEISGNIYYEYNIQESPNAIISIFNPNEQDYQTGGFCSICYGEIENCKNKVNIYIHRLLKKSNNTVVGYTQSIGGICGELYNGQIANCINYGNINTTGYTGGICGKIINGKVINCANYGDILGGNQTGGIIGCGTGDSENDNSYIEISNTYNMGTITNGGSTLGGGIAGYLPQIENVCISNSYNCGQSGNAILGTGITAKITNCYYLSASSIRGVWQGDDTAVAKSEANMKKESFAEQLGPYFVYQENGYPVLAWEIDPDVVITTTTTTSTTTTTTTSTTTTTKKPTTTTTTTTTHNITTSIMKTYATAKTVSADYSGDETEFDKNQIQEVTEHLMYTEGYTENGAFYITKQWETVNDITDQVNFGTQTPQSIYKKGTTKSEYQIPLYYNDIPLKSKDNKPITVIAYIGPESIATTIPPVTVKETTLTLANREQYTIVPSRSDVTYQSNNKTVAIVSDKGVIEAIGTGNAVISVIDSDSNVAQINVTVRELTTTSTTTSTTTTTTTTMIPLSVNVSTLSLTNGEQYTVTANRKDVTFESNNKLVAIVSPKGVITAIGEGTATISAIDSESNVVQIKVTVKPVTTTSTTTTTTTTPKTTTTTLTTTTTSVAYNLGDVNNDNLINAVDASTVLTYYAMISTNKNGNFTDTQKQAADVNHDGSINAVDASIILSYYAYISTKEKINFNEYIKTV